MKFTELQDIMREHGIVNLIDIAKVLEVSPQSVSNWKSRDQVPYKYVIEIQDTYVNDKHNVEPDIQNIYKKENAALGKEISQLSENENKIIKDEG